jgi:uncharacterized protein (DUF302 family)
MYYIAKSNQPFEQTARDLEAAVVCNGFGVLNILDLGATLRGKGLEFA